MPVVFGRPAGCRTGRTDGLHIKVGYIYNRLGLGCLLQGWTALKIFTSSNLHVFIVLYKKADHSMQEKAVLKLACSAVLHSMKLDRPLNARVYCLKMFILANFRCLSC